MSTRGASFVDGFDTISLFFFMSYLPMILTRWMPTSTSSSNRWFSHDFAPLLCVLFVVNTHPMFLLMGLSSVDDADKGFICSRVCHMILIRLSSNCRHFTFTPLLLTHLSVILTWSTSTHRAFVVGFFSNVCCLCTILIRFASPLSSVICWRFWYDLSTNVRYSSAVSIFKTIKRAIFKKVVDQSVMCCVMTPLEALFLRERIAFGWSFGTCGVVQRQECLRLRTVRDHPKLNCMA